MIEIQEDLALQIATALFEDTLAQAWAYAFERQEMAAAYINHAHQGRDKAKAADQASTEHERGAEPVLACAAGPACRAQAPDSYPHG